MNPIMTQAALEPVVRSAHRSVHLAADQGGLFGGGSLGTVLLVVGMVLAVTIVSGLGFIARMNDRSAERKAARRATDDPGSSDPSAG